MKFRTLGPLALLIAALALVPGGVAEARNEHCAGGIQYVVQAMKDKDKGNTDDYQREINKAVQQLTECASVDGNDLEALGYLGWALAEVDSAGPAGQAFQKSIDGLRAKGDAKKADWVSNNRDSYWATRFNDGIAKINAAGSNFLGKAEIDAVAVRRCESIVVDSKDQARIEAGDFVQALEDGSIHWADVHELGQVIVGRYTGRAHPQDVTLFKSLGIAIEDVAVAAKVYAKAQAAGIGRTVEW